MVEPYNVLSGTQTDINRRLLRMIEELQNSSESAYDDTEIKKDIKDLEDAIGDESTADTILGRIKALEDAS